MQIFPSLFPLYTYLPLITTYKFYKWRKINYHIYYNSYFVDYESSLLQIQETVLLKKDSRVYYLWFSELKELWEIFFL